MNTLYSIKINKTGRYVKYCDDSWYETIDEPVRLFTKKEAEDVAKKLKRHYVYDVTITDGTETIVSGRETVKPAQKLSTKSFKIKLNAKK